MNSRTTQPTNSPSSFACQRNHTLCVEEALTQAKKVCEKEGERFTDLRQQVFTMVWAGHKPVKAYDLLTELSAKRSGVAPATVYRTLDFLQARGLVHKLESLNAYLGCSQPEKDHQGYFLVCENCNEVRELESPFLRQAIEEVEQTQYFQIRHSTVEVFGLCVKCQKA